MSVRPSSALYKVTSSIYSRSPPAGTPLAIRLTLIPSGFISLLIYVAVVSPYVSYILTLLFAILIGGFVIMNFTRGMVSLRRIKEVLDTEPDVKFDPNAPTAPEKGSIEFDNVSFTYPDSDKPTLENISFKVKAGRNGWYRWSNWFW